MSILDLLIRFGADVNEICEEWSGRRPLHLIATHSNLAIARPLIELLLAHGAHLDVVDRSGHFPQDLARTLDVKELLRIDRQLSLKCRCAQIIASTRMNYETMLPPSLIPFVQLHSNSKRDNS